MGRDHDQGHILCLSDLLYDLGDYARWGVDPQGSREVPVQAQCVHSCRVGVGVWAYETFRLSVGVGGH